MTKQEIDSKIKGIVDEIAENYKPDKIFLFGSFAWGNPTEDSDVDLFVVKETDRSSFDRMRDVQRILFGKGIAVDVLVYTPKEVDESVNKNKNLFVEDILRNGKIVYENSKKSIKFKLPARSLAILH